MKQTWPECKAQAHTSACAVSQGRKDKQPHMLLMCGTEAALPLLLLCCASACCPGQKCRISANSTLLEWPTVQTASYSGPFLMGFGGSHPCPEHLVCPLLPTPMYPRTWGVLSPHSSLKETTCIVVSSSPLFHPCSSCNPSELSQAKAEGAPWSPHQHTLKASLERSSRAKPADPAHRHFVRAGEKAWKSI